MRWISIDPATKTGIARWDGGALVGVSTLRPPLKKEARQHPGAALVLVNGTNVAGLASPFVAWSFLVAGVGAVIVEEGMGGSEKSIAQLAFRRGYIARECDGRHIRHKEVNSKAWKKAVGEHYGAKFPGYSKLDKEHAVALVERHFGRSCSGDEADAVLVGVWAMLSGVAPT